MKLDKAGKTDYVADIKTILATARRNTYSAVNSEMVQAYWLIGQRIVLEEQNGKERAEYGKYIIENISEELRKEFGKGYSQRSIREYRQFYLAFPEIRRTPSAELQNAKNEEIAVNVEIRRTLFAESNTLHNLSWSHCRLIMRISNKEARAWYIKETAQNNWSVRTLDRNISTQYYERLLLSQSAAPVEKEMQEKTKNFQLNKMEFIKSPSVLEFLNLPANTGYTEAELEKAIITNIQKFLLELGKGYAFVDRQKIIRTENRDYFIDLVFYNFILKCFVLIDLKTERITHQDVGQMDMYVRMYDEKERNEGDNPTVGIVLCSETDKDIARYSILKGNEQIFASKYKLYLPTEEELRNEIERQKLHLKLQMGKGGTHE